MLGGVCTNSIDLNVEAVPRITGLSGFNFNEDTVGTNAFALTYGDPEATLTYAATFAPTNIIQSYEFTGTKPAKNLVLTPYPNAYGTNIVTVVVSDNEGIHSETQAITVVVNPIPDAPMISGLPSEIILSSTLAWMNVFSEVTITDPDDFPAGAQTEISSVTVSSPDSTVIFEGYGSDSTIASTNTTGLLSDWLKNLAMKPRDGFSHNINITNVYQNISVRIDGDDGEFASYTLPLKFWLKNTAPIFLINVDNVSRSVVEGGNIAPFKIDDVVDPEQIVFMLSARLGSRVAKIRAFQCRARHEFYRGGRRQRLHAFQQSWRVVFPCARRRDDH